MSNAFEQSFINFRFTAIWIQWQLYSYVKQRSFISSVWLFSVSFSTYSFHCFLSNHTKVMRDLFKSADVWYSIIQYKNWILFSNQGLSLSLSLRLALVFNNTTQLLSFISYMCLRCVCLFCGRGGKTSVSGSEKLAGICSGSDLVERSWRETGVYRRRV